MNLLQVVNKSKIIEERAAKILNNLVADYNHGLIKTETELLYKTFLALKEFYKSIGKPTFKVRPARGTPVSSDYNDMINESVSDMASAISECESLSQALSQMFTEVELDRNMMQNKIRYVLKQIEMITSKVGDRHNAISFSDSFVNTNNFDKDMCKNLIANVNTSEGILTLATTSSDDYSVTCKVEVLDGSNGIPGNTHVVDVVDNSLHFHGEDNLHIDLSTITDGNRDTWFEYEIFDIDDATYFNTNGYGYEYKEGLKWINSGEPLRLILRLTLPTPKIANWLSLSPFIPEHKGSKASSIQRIIISDGKGNVQSISSTRVFSDDIIYVFNQQSVKTITIEFEQRLAYDTDIGHFFFVETANTNPLYYDTSTDGFSRVDGPKPSVEMLGLKYNPSLKKYVQPTSEDKVFSNQSKTKQELFSQPLSYDNIKSDTEILKAYRYHIGIRSINISSYTFESESEYISTEYVSEVPIKGVALDVADSIPATFGVGEWVKYRISTDNGETWHDITPKSRAYSGKSTYIINSKIPIELRKSNVGYIEQTSDVYSVRLKIELSRPTENTGDVFCSPIVYNYTIKAMTGDDVNEY